MAIVDLRPQIRVLLLRRRQRTQVQSVQLPTHIRRAPRRLPSERRTRIVLIHPPIEQMRRRRRALGSMRGRVISSRFAAVPYRIASPPGVDGLTTPLSRIHPDEGVEVGSSPKSGLASGSSSSCTSVLANTFTHGPLRPATPLCAPASPAQSAAHSHRQKHKRSPRAPPSPEPPDHIPRTCLSSARPPQGTQPRTLQKNPTIFGNQCLDIESSSSRTSLH